MKSQDYPLFDQITPEQPKALSVSQLNRGVKLQLEGAYSQVLVRGEISNFKPHSSGHFYFALKDAQSQISAVMFRGMNSKLDFRPKNGMEVLVFGAVTVYEPRGSYQIMVRTMEELGAGALQREFEALKKKLQIEGLFSPENKKTLPLCPFKIALITSPTGAAVKDMIQVLGRRHPAAEIIVIPCLTQGAGAPASLIQGLELLAKLKVDVAIIGRGGGSMEDLWGFNDEALARKIFQCETPIVSAVGHEIDFTISDFVADFRAPTPSAAAEQVTLGVERYRKDLVHFQLSLKNVVLSRRDFAFQKLNHVKRQLVQSHKNAIGTLKEKIFHLVKRFRDPRAELLQKRQRTDELSQRLESGFKNKIKSTRRDLALKQDFLLNRYPKNLKNLKQKLVALAQMMDHLSPLKVLGRGYAFAKIGDSLVTQAGQLKEKDELQVYFQDGHANVRVQDTKIEAASAKLKK